jgi:hypothetical protein
VELGALVQQTSRTAADVAGAVARLPNLVVLLEESLTAVRDARLAELPARLDDITAMVARLEQRIDDALPSMRDTVERLGGEVEQIERGLDTVIAAVSGIVADMGKLGAQVGSLSDDLLRVLRWVPSRRKGDAPEA